MAHPTDDLDRRLVADLRRMAREGKSPSELFTALRGSLGDRPHILTVVEYFRRVFCLSLSEAKPLAALSRNEGRTVDDQALLDELLLPEIASHRTDGDD